MTLIRGHGPSNPSAMLIADAPQGEDLVSGYALTGAQEAMIRGFCKDVGLSLGDFWRTTLLKEDASKAGYPNLADLEESKKALTDVLKESLRDEVNSLKPQLLIPLGELSFNHLTTLRGIRKFRGSVVLADAALGFNKPTKVMPILGPYPYLYSDHKQRHITRIDFAKIGKYLNDNLPPDNLHNLWIARTSSALRSFLERSYKDDGLLVFDIETYMGCPTCLSFCFDGFESVCIPLLDPSIDLDQRVLMVDLVARILSSPIKKVNQNIKYDWKIMERWGFRVSNVVGDTMLAASCLYCEFPKNLGFLTSIYTDLPYFKDEGREFDPTKHSKNQFYLYNAKDSLATHQIHTKQTVEIAEQGLDFVYDKLIQLMPLYKRMEDNGLRRDEEQRFSLLAKYESLYNIHKLQLQQMTGEFEINPLSSVVMNRLVFNDLGYTKIRGVQGTDEESLQLLLAYGQAKRSPNFGPDILQTIINCRKIHKVLEILELPIWPDGRFRCEFNLGGTKTGRTSAGETTDQLIVLTDKNKVKAVSLGHSLQTIGKHGFFIDGVQYGKDIRSMFVASKGYSFVECDLSQAEARVDAVLAGNYQILGVFDGPVGIHRLTGSWVYDVPPESIKKNTLEYHMAKTVRHAGERNMREDRMMAMTQRPLEECRRILKKFHETQPEIRNVFHRDIMTAMNATRCLIAPNGRRHDFFDRIDQHAYNEGISFLPQAIVSDQTKFSFISTTAECPWARMLTEQHDGSLWEVPKGKEKTFAAAYTKNVTEPIDFSQRCSLKRDFELVIPCESSVGGDWQNMRDLEL